MGQGPNCAACPKQYFRHSRAYRTFAIDAHPRLGSIAVFLWIGRLGHGLGEWTWVQGRRAPRVLGVAAVSTSENCRKANSGLCTLSRSCTGIQTTTSLVRLFYICQAVFEDLEQEMAQSRTSETSQRQRWSLHKPCIFSSPDQLRCILHEDRSGVSSQCGAMEKACARHGPKSLRCRATEHSAHRVGLRSDTRWWPVGATQTTDIWWPAVSPCKYPEHLTSEIEAKRSLQSLEPHSGTQPTHRHLLPGSPTCCFATSPSPLARPLALSPPPFPSPQRP